MCALSLLCVIYLNTLLKLLSSVLFVRGLIWTARKTRLTLRAKSKNEDKKNEERKEFSLEIFKWRRVEPFFVVAACCYVRKLARLQVTNKLYSK